MAIRETLTTFLERHRVAHLATCDASGRPHVVPICYTIDEGTLYSVIDRKPKRRPPGQLRRVRNLLMNPRVAAVVDTYSEDWSQLWYVLVEGTARVIEDGPEHSAALRLLQRKYPQYRGMTLDDRPVIAIAIERTVTWGRLSP
jgi:PPOX class probable F420-dependent enzyme